MRAASVLPSSIVAKVKMLQHVTDESDATKLWLPPNWEQGLVSEGDEDRSPTVDCGSTARRH